MNVLTVHKLICSDSWLINNNICNVQITTILNTVSPSESEGGIKNPEDLELESIEDEDEDIEISITSQLDCFM